MISDQSIIAALSGYENSLVKQFRVMETLVGISIRERQLIVKGSIDPLVKNTEEKEAALDKFGLLEENSRMYLQKIALKLNIQSERTNIRDILPYLEKEDSERITRLMDGINTLAASAKDLNLGNQALVITRMDWLKATHSFITSLMQPENAYSMPLMAKANRDSSVSSMEFKV